MSRAPVMWSHCSPEHWPRSQYTGDHNTAQSHPCSSQDNWSGLIVCQTIISHSLFIFNINNSHQPSQPWLCTTYNVPFTMYVTRLRYNQPQPSISYHTGSSGSILLAWYIVSPLQLRIYENRWLCFVMKIYVHLRRKYNLARKLYYQMKSKANLSIWNI